MSHRSTGVLRLLQRHPVSQALLGASAGCECHLVGGVVRDRLLGLPCADFDAVVERDGEAIAERLARSLPARPVRLGGKEFAAYRLVGRDFELDLWDRQGGSLASDLLRRDFTVNAMALDLRSGDLADPHGGLRDLQDRILRAVGPDSFAGDPLRVLRLPRLLLQLPGFAADPATVDLARRQTARLTEVAAERVRDELARILASREAHRGVALLEALHVYPGLWLGRPGEAMVVDHTIGELEWLEPCALAVRRGAPSGVAGDPDLEAARWGLLFASLPQPLETLRRFARAGYVLRQRADEAAALLHWEDLPAGELLQRRFLHDCGALWPTAAAFLGARHAARGEVAAWTSWLRETVGVLGRVGAWILDPPALLTGHEVQRELGLAPGPEVGRALALVRQAQVDGTVADRATALALLRRRAAPG